MAGNLPVVPSRASLSASGRAAAPSTIRNGGSQRFFGSHNNVARPASFQQQTASLRQTMQQNHVGAVPAGGRASAEFSRGGNSMQRPSAGIQPNRGTSNSGARNNAGRVRRDRMETVEASGSSTRLRTTGSGNTRYATSRGTANHPGGFRQFNPPTNNTRPNEMNNGSPARSNQSPAENRGGFRPFTPPQTNNTRSRSSEMRVRIVRSRSGVVQNSASENRGGFRPFTPPSNSGVSRGPSSGNYSRGGNTTTGTVPRQVPRVPATMARARTATAAEPPGRSSICGSQSFVARRMAGIPAEVILQLLQVTVAHEALPVTARRVPALLATVEGRTVRQAMAEAVVVMPQVAEAAIQRRWRWRESFQRW